MKITREILVKRTAEDIFTMFRGFLAISPTSNSKVVEFEEIPELQKILPKTIPVGESIFIDGDIINFANADEDETNKRKRRKKNKPTKPSVFTILKYNVNKEVSCRVKQHPFIDATINVKLTPLGSLTKLQLLVRIRLPWFLKPFSFLFTKLVNAADGGEWLAELKESFESLEIYELLQNNSIWQAETTVE